MSRHPNRHARKYPTGIDSSNVLAYEEEGFAHEAISHSAPVVHPNIDAARSRTDLPRTVPTRPPVTDAQAAHMVVHAVGAEGYRESANSCVLDPRHLHHRRRGENWGAARHRTGVTSTEGLANTATS
jgi:hypothetical protein